MKLIGNLLVAAQMASLGEALALSARPGWTHAVMHGVLDVVRLQLVLIRNVGRATWPAITAGFLSAAYAEGHAADRRLRARLDVPLPATGAIQHLYQAR